MSRLILIYTSYYLLSTRWAQRRPDQAWWNTTHTILPSLRELNVRPISERGAVRVCDFVVTDPGAGMSATPPWSWRNFWLEIALRWYVKASKFDALAVFGE
jgi:hypothetical protein